MVKKKPRITKPIGMWSDLFFERLKVKLKKHVCVLVPGPPKSIFFGYQMRSIVRFLTNLY